MIMPTLCDNFAVANQYTTHQWIRHHAMSATLSEFNRSGHEFGFVGHDLHAVEVAVTNDTTLTNNS
jgi:hypothetical protein